MKIRKKYGDKNIVGKRIYELRTRRGIKQKEFLAWIQVAGIDMNPSSLSKIEGQERMVTDSEVKVIAKVLNVSSDYLLGMDKEH